MTDSRQKAATYAILVLLAAAYGLFLLIHAGSMRLIPTDETDIFVPVMERVLSGVPYAPGKYPTFPFLFFEAGIRTLRLIPAFRGMDFLHLGRLLNALLATANLLLFFAACRPWLGRPWALAAVFLFAVSPPVFYSGVYLKTEALSLFTILLAFLAARRLTARPSDPLRHALLAVPCALALCVKYNAPLSVIYPAALILSGRRASRPGRNVAVFLLAFSGTVYLAWPTLRHIVDLPLASLKKDAYFAAGPMICATVAEPGSFPYGTVSYPLIFLLPMFLGMVQYPATILALLLRSVPRQPLALWGGFTGLYLALVIASGVGLGLNPFVPATPFFAFASACLFGKLASAPRRALLKAAAAALALCCLALAAYQATWGVRVQNAMTGAMEDVRESLDREGLSDDYCMYLFQRQCPPAYGFAPEDTDRAVAEQKPRYILALDSYFANFCLYRNNPGYARQCQFFKDLISGRAGYETVWVREPDYPMKSLFWDPHKSFTFYLLRRKPGPPPPGRSPAAPALTGQRP